MLFLLQYSKNKTKFFYFFFISPETNKSIQCSLLSSYDRQIFGIYVSKTNLVNSYKYFHFEVYCNHEKCSNKIEQGKLKSINASKKKRKKKSNDLRAKTTKPTTTILSWIY